MQIVNWRTHLKFPEEAKLSPEAKDIISKLLCNVSHRLVTNGADEIKVSYGVSYSRFLDLSPWTTVIWCELPCFWFHYQAHCWFNGVEWDNFIRWRLHFFLRLMMNWILKILKSLMRFGSLDFFRILLNYQYWEQYRLLVMFFPFLFPG